MRAERGHPSLADASDDYQLLALRQLGEPLEHAGIASDMHFLGGAEPRQRLVEVAGVTHFLFRGETMRIGVAARFCGAGQVASDVRVARLTIGG